MNRWLGNIRQDFPKSIVQVLQNDALGAPCIDLVLAGQMTALGAPAFACTPDLFPDLMATTIQKGDIAAWAARNQTVIKGRS
jgi:hypothetical protein